MPETEHQGTDTRGRNSIRTDIKRRDRTRQDAIGKDQVETLHSIVYRRAVLFAVLLLGLTLRIGSAGRLRPAPPDWEAEGTLLEACSCAVPCTCNFGQGPSRDYCHTVYAYRLKRGRYGSVKLDGLAFGGGEGAAGRLGFLDARATEAQRPALEKLATAVFGKGGASPGPRKFQIVTLSVESDARTFRVNFAGSGGFRADVLLGADGKNPIVVENNVTWPVHRFIKGKTTHFDYRDSVGNRLKFDGVNANVGEFRLAGNAK